ncbi:MAG: hypothetical protein U0271_36815 [Polyangiaceae bacterium]
MIQGAFRSRALVGVALLAAACGDRSAPAPSKSVAGTVSTALGSTGASPSSAAAPSAATHLPVSREALLEIAVHAPDRLAPTDPSGSLVGTETSASAAPIAKRPSQGEMLRIRPDVKASSASGERDLRATLYFDLVDQCRGAGGAPLPPEVVDISFRVDPQGYIDRTSVHATPSSAEFEEAARCMERVIRTANARFAPPRMPEPTNIQARVPSVD